MANYEVKFRKAHQKIREKIFFDNPNEPFVKKLIGELLFYDQYKILQRSPNITMSVDQIKALEKRKP